MAEGRVLWVSPDGTRWKVKWEGDGVDSYHDTQTAGIARARAIVRSNPAGYVRQIKVQRPDGTIREEWTYGKDPYPPAG
jgi:hypothetical protein